jgi:hypothetical protein
MITGLHGDRLDSWIAAVRTDDLPHLHAFANGLERDHAAVLNGLTLPYSSGAVGGKVGKDQVLERLMFGRADLDLLRKMALKITTCSTTGPDSRALSLINPQRRPVGVSRPGPPFAAWQRRAPLRCRSLARSPPRGLPQRSRQHFTGTDRKTRVIRPGRTECIRPWSTA